MARNIKLTDHELLLVVLGIDVLVERLNRKKELNRFDRRRLEALGEMRMKVAAALEGEWV